MGISFTPLLQILQGCAVYQYRSPSAAPYSSCLLYTSTVEEAIEEADFVISLLRDHEINGPVAYDWEMHDSTYRVYGTTPEMATACAIAFCQRIAEAGYTPMIYAGQYVSYIKYDQGAIAPYLDVYKRQHPCSAWPASESWGIVRM